MGISYCPRRKLFHLQAGEMSYVIKIYHHAYLSHLYWGRRIKESNESNLLQFKYRLFSPNPEGFDRTFSLDTLPQEYPAHGNTDFRTPAYQIQFANGTTITDLKYKQFHIYKGKRDLAGLPATYVEDAEESTSIDITLMDEQTGLIVILTYCTYENDNVITRSVRVINYGEKPVKILKAMSASVDFRESDYDLLTLYGAHANECNLSRKHLAAGSHLIESTRGASSHQHNPFVCLAKPDANEEYGEVYGFSLVYSGNFLAQAEVDQYKTTRLSIGINPFNFSWYLEVGETFQTPEAVLVYSYKGLNDMSRTYHELYRFRLARGLYRDCLRPVLLNNWEATYFKFNYDKLEQLAQAGKELGVELFVMDDGWFGKRNNAKTSLGDWKVNEQKLPGGLKKLAERINQLGMKFGLWFEPEMVSMDSDLFRKYPDWCIHVPNRPKSLGRDQLVLDLTREEVCEYIIEAVSDVLSSAPISYVKWDMNRHMTEVGSSALSPERQRETGHRYMLGLYTILEVLTNRHPTVLFESCSGGGGRFDPGMLFYMPQVWTSDNTDAVSRLKIQYGTSLVYPPVTIGAHVSASPNHQVHRHTSLSLRGHVALSGNLGYELDLAKLSQSEKEIIKEQIKLYKEIRAVIQFGTFYRLLSPFTGNQAAWQFVSPDLSETVVMYFRLMAQPAEPFRILRLRGLNPVKKYFDKDTSLLYGGDELMYAGLSIPEMKGDYCSMLWRFSNMGSNRIPI